MRQLAYQDGSAPSDMVLVTTHTSGDIGSAWPLLSELQRAVLDGLYALSQTGGLDTLSDVVRLVVACGPGTDTRQPVKTVRALVNRGFIVVLDRTPVRLEDHRCCLDRDASSWLGERFDARAVLEAESIDGFDRELRDAT